jgi:hypothetical protein
VRTTSPLVLEIGGNSAGGRFGTPLYALLAMTAWLLATRPAMADGSSNCEMQPALAFLVSPFEFAEVAGQAGTQDATAAIQLAASQGRPPSPATGGNNIP